MKKIKFGTTVDTSIVPPIFTFYNEDNQATNGNVTVYHGEKASIDYTLDTPGYYFVVPAITNNFNQDVEYVISEKAQKLSISFTPSADYEDIGLQLIIQHICTGQKYASPDPKIKAKPGRT
ncbi:DP-EP family protein [Agaribacter flavus]|uniref:DP-EP family protein n=1 Tax=Agaribacter flavus TaxID=1902781 RepID=A0ABV7FLX8_9ALTE